MLSENYYLKTTGRDGVPLFGVGNALVEDSSDWYSAEAEIAMNINGFHVCRNANDVLTWIGPELWMVEARGYSIENGDGAVFQEIRPVRRLMDEDDWRLFAIERARMEYAVIVSEYMNEHVRDQLLDLIAIGQDYLDFTVSRDMLAKAHREANNILSRLAMSFAHAEMHMPDTVEILIMSVIHALSPEPWCVMGWVTSKKIHPDDVISAGIQQRHVSMLETTIKFHIEQKESASHEAV